MDLVLWSSPTFGRWAGVQKPETFVDVICTFTLSISHLPPCLEFREAGQFLSPLVLEKVCTGEVLID